MGIVEEPPKAAGNPPTRGEIVGSTALTLAVSIGVGLVATLLVGAVLVFFDIANTDPAADWQTQTGLPPIVFQVALVAILVVIWLVACRAGSGAPGEAMLGVKLLDPSGAAATPAQQRIRAAAYVGVFAVLALLERAGAGAVVLLLLWLPSLLRRDRRSVVDLLVGVVPHSTRTVRDAQPHPWAR